MKFMKHEHARGYTGWSGQGNSVAQKKTKIKNDEIALEVSFLRKSSLKMYEVCVNLTNFRLDRDEQLAGDFVLEEIKFEYTVAGKRNLMT